MGIVVSCVVCDVVVIIVLSGCVFEFDDIGDRVVSLLCVVNGCDLVCRCRCYGILGW